MALITPEAQTPFSPVEQPRTPYDLPGVGDALSAVGQAGVNIEIDRVERQRGRQMRDARVTAIERLGELRTQYEQDPNVSGLSDRYVSDSEAVFAEIAASLPEGRMREDFLIDARKVRAPQQQAVARREYALERDEARASGRFAVRTVIEQSALAPDDESRAAILSEGAAIIAGMKEDGHISAQEEEAFLQTMAQDSALALAVRTAADDPEAFLAAKADGIYGGVDTVMLERMETSAKASIAQRDAKAARALDIEAKTAAKALTSDVDDTVEILESGLSVPSEHLDDLRERAAGTPEAARLDATIAAAQTEVWFANLTPRERKTVIAEKEADPTTDPGDIGRLDALRKIDARSKESEETDPLSHVADRGIVTLAPVDVADATSVRNRIDVAETIALEYQNGETPPQVRYFTNPERAQMQEAISKGDPDAQLALATSIVGSFGNRAGRALAELGGDDPIFELAGNLVWQSNDPVAARTMLMGRQMTAKGEGAKVDAKVRSAVRPTFAGAFPPGAQDRVGSVIAAADLHFAASGFLLNPDADAATKRAAYMRSVQAVTGQVVRNGEAYGGLQDVNGQQTLLPPNFTAEGVKLALSKATDETWAAASLSGGGPMYGRTSLAEQMRRGFLDEDDLLLMSVGDGYYMLGMRRRDGELRWFGDTSSADGRYRVNLRMLTESSGGN